jgi:hypothetical protein
MFRVDAIVREVEAGRVPQHVRVNRTGIRCVHLGRAVDDLPHGRVRDWATDNGLNEVENAQQTVGSVGNTRSYRIADHGVTLRETLHGCRGPEVQILSPRPKSTS